MNKKIILIIVIILLVILIGLLIMLGKNKQGTNTLENQINEVKASKLENEAKNYYTISSIIKEFNSYILYINGSISDLDVDLIPGETESDVLQEYQEEGYEYFNDVLANIYKSKYSVDKKYILNAIGKFAKVNYSIEDIYITPEQSSVNSYYVFGKYGETDYNFIIVLDENNSTFEIVLDNYMKDAGITKDDAGTMKALGVTSIEENDNNSFQVKNVDEKIIVKDYFDEYIALMKSNPEAAYEKLNAEYKSKRFNSYDEFKAYADKIIEVNEGLKLRQYKTTEMKNYTELVCQYDFGRVMVFYVKDQNKYSVALDSYTIPVQAYDFEYNNSTEDKKAKLCVNRFLESINNDDYKKAYEYLNSSFKSNNYASEEEFKQYINSEWFNLNGIYYKTTNVSGTTYIVSGSIYDLYDEGSFDAATIYKNFMVRLGNGYNSFELSFEK